MKDECFKKGIFYDKFDNCMQIMGYLVCDVNPNLSGLTADREDNPEEAFYPINLIMVYLGTRELEERKLDRIEREKKVQEWLKANGE